MPSPEADGLSQEAPAASSAAPPPASISRAVNALDDKAFQRLYGPWQAWPPAEVAERFAGAPFTWWIVGGWSLDVGSARRREHEDTDIAVLAGELQAVRTWLRDFHLWEADSGSLRPLLPDLPITPLCQQLWMRRDAMSPWLLDLPLAPAADDRWLYKRDHRVQLPLSEVVVTGPGGVPYQRPEITLLFKARLQRPKDEADFAATLPTLGVAARRWLYDSLSLTEPGHPWIAEVRP